MMTTEDDQMIVDPHLNPYYQNRRIRRHLIKAGLIDPQGQILTTPSDKTLLSERKRRTKVNEDVTNAFRRYILEEKKSRENFVRQHYGYPKQSVRIDATKMPQTFHAAPLKMIDENFKTSRSRSIYGLSPRHRKRSPVRPISANYTPVYAINSIVRRPTTAKKSPKDLPCLVTVMYLGLPNNGDYARNSIQKKEEIIVMQQHSGGENLTVFKGQAKANELITFESHRHRDFPFALTMYINGLINTRISVCCEYKHKRNIRLGSKQGLFTIYNVENGKPCQSCEFIRHYKKTGSLSLKNIHSSRRQNFLASHSSYKTEFPVAESLGSSVTLNEKRTSLSESNNTSMADQSTITANQQSDESNETDQNRLNQSTSNRKTVNDNIRTVDPRMKSASGKMVSRTSSSSSSESDDRSSNKSSTKSAENQQSSDPTWTKKSPQMQLKSTDDENTPRSHGSNRQKDMPVGSQSTSHSQANNTDHSTSSSQKLNSKTKQKPKLNFIRTDSSTDASSNDEEHDKSISLKKKSSSHSSSSGTPSNIEKQPNSRSDKSNDITKLKSNNDNASENERSSDSSSSISGQALVKSLMKASVGLEQIKPLQSDSESQRSQRSKGIKQIPLLRDTLPASSSSSPSLSSSPKKSDNKTSEFVKSRDLSTTESEDDPSLSKLAEKYKPFKSTSKASSTSSNSTMVAKNSQSLQKNQINPDASKSNSESENDSLSEVVKANKIEHQSLSKSSSSTSVSTSEKGNLMSPKPHSVTTNKSKSTSENDIHEKSFSLQQSDLINKTSGDTSSFKNNKKTYDSSDESSDSASNKSTTKNYKETEKKTLSTSDSTDDDTANETQPGPLSRKHKTQEQKKPKFERENRPVEDIIIIWFDENIDNDDSDIILTKTNLRRIVRTIKTFTDKTKCSTFIESVKNEKIFLVLSGRMSENFLEEVHDSPQIVVIYIFCEHTSKYQHLFNLHSKVKGIYSNISVICDHLKIYAKQWENDLNTFHVCSENQSQQKSFVQNQLFKKYLIEIKYDRRLLNDLLDYCKRIYKENKDELNVIKDFKNNYQSGNALSWYTKDSFIYHMLNRAIRMKDVKILYQMGSFIHDMNNQLEQIYSNSEQKSKLTVFRGQGMKTEYFNELKNNQNGLLSFNGFVSTSRERTVAYKFAQDALSNGFPVAILFQINVDPTDDMSLAFASLETMSFFQSEYEILFSLKTIFHIESIEQIDSNLWQVDLAVVNKNSNNIFNLINEENEKYNHSSDFEKLGDLLMDMKEYLKAKHVYEFNMPTVTDANFVRIYMKMALIETSLENYPHAIFCYKKLLASQSKEISEDYSMMSVLHRNIAQLLYKTAEYEKAMNECKVALDIHLKHSSSPDALLMSIYQLMAEICQESSNFEDALNFYEKQLEIENALSDDSDNISLTHYNICICLENLERYEDAMNHIQQSIDLLPPNHSELSHRQISRNRIQERLQ